MHEILKYLKAHGERLDSDIAKATGISLEKVRLAWLPAVMSLCAG